MDLFKHTNELVDIKSTLGWMLMNEANSEQREEKLWDIVRRIDEAAEISHAMEKEQETVLRNILDINDKAIAVDNYACGAYHEYACEEMASLFASIDTAVFHLIEGNNHLNNMFKELHKPR